MYKRQSQDGYCEEKAREFVGKLESWGWVCLETVSASADTEQAEEAMEETEEAVEEAVEETEETMEQAVESEEDPDTQ